jgi:hypothetical protein
VSDRASVSDKTYRSLLNTCIVNFVKIIGIGIWGTEVVILPIANGVILTQGEREN